ncbi:hypothetical protein KI387_002149, partial [Taxus chinensis]
THGLLKNGRGYAVVSPLKGKYLDVDVPVSPSLSQILPSGSIDGFLDASSLGAQGRVKRFAEEDKSSARPPIKAMTHAKASPS